MKNNSQIQNNFYWLYLIGIFLILTLPLLSFPPTFHPAAWAKSIIFRIIFSTLIFFFIWEILFKKEKLVLFWQKIRHSKATLPFWLLVALFGIFLLATIFSLDPRFSFWGSPYRGGGFLTFGLCIIFAIFIFLNLRGKDWQKILDFALVVGCLTAIIAIFQKLGLFSKYIVSYDWRPVSTMGGPIFLALYLVLLVFLPLAFGITSKGKKKIFYFSCLILLSIGIILAATRAVFLGFFIGFLFFIFFYPKKSFAEKYSKKVIWLKISTVIIIILGIFGFFWLKTQPQFVQVLEKNILFGSGFKKTWSFAENFSLNEILDSRGSGWKVAFEAIKDRPLLGYGPENFSIGFDKFYDPTLQGIIKQPSAGSSGWWDRGHGFIFDVSVSAGIPALIIYLSLFGALFWRLQKVKKKNPDKAIISHGLQATFIGYLTANFFSFDLFSTYLIFFLLVGYSFYLISGSQENIEEQNQQQSPPKKTDESTALNPSKYIFIIILCFILVWFIWSANIKPLQINKKINEAVFLSKGVNSVAQDDLMLAKKQYPIVLKRMEDIMSEKSFIDNYLRLQYIDIISLAAKIMPEKNAELSLRAIQILEECVELRPYYTRSWLYLSMHINNYIGSTPNLKLELKEKLNKEFFISIEKAKKLSPRHPEIFITLAKNDLINKKYQEAKEKAEECINFAPDNGDCWWVKSLALISLNESEEALKAMETASEKGYKVESKKALSQLINTYANLAKSTGDIKYYENVVEIYQKLIEIEPKNFQFHASLSYVYKVLEEYDKAREEAMIVIELSPESKANVGEFLESLPE